MINKKILLTTVLEVLFTVILVLLLVFVRYKSINYLSEVNSLSENVKFLQNDLSSKNLTTYEQAGIQSTLDKMDSLLNKGLILIKFVLPISLLILS